MVSQGVAIVFPGQGAYSALGFRQAREQHTQINTVFAAMAPPARRIAGISLPEVFDREPPETGALLSMPPVLSQLALYGTAVAGYRVLQSFGVEGEVLLGHSLGEIAALVCAGMCDEATGAEIVCHRTLALERLGKDRGAMLALGIDPERARALVALVGGGMAVAAENFDEQTVVSGPDAGIDRVHAVATALGLPVHRLASPFAFHCPTLMTEVARDFAHRIAQLPLRAPRARVFSPILGRYYRDDDDLIACLASHLVQPVRFQAALQELAQSGMGTFIESATSDAISRLVHRALPGASVRAFSALLPRSGGHTLRTALTEVGLFTPTLTADLAAILLPGVDHPTFARFWNSNGPAIVRLVRIEFEKSAVADNSTEPARVSSTRTRQIPKAAPAAPPHGDRSRLLQTLAAMFAEALEYPAEVFGEDVDLEAELGVDSVKQMEMFAKLEERFQLPPRSSDFRAADYRTLGKIADLILSTSVGDVATSAGNVEAGAPAPVTPIGAPHSAPHDNAAHDNAVAPNKPANGVGRNGNGISGASRMRSRETLLAELTQLFSAMLEYPIEVLGEDVGLEAELGVDSVKQMELLARVEEQYGLPPRGADFRPGDYGTIGRITDLVLQANSGTAASAA